MLDEYIRLDTTIIAIDNLINEAATGTMARTLFEAKDTIYNQQRYVIDVQPVKHGKWEHGKCTNCEKSLEDLFSGDFYWDDDELHFCPNCGARMQNEIKPAYTVNNADDLRKAIDGLNQFTKNYCMNVKETTEKNDLTFRCKECQFSGKNNDGKCLIKAFAYDEDGEYANSIDFGAMGAL